LQLVEIADGSDRLTAAVHESHRLEQVALRSADPDLAGVAEETVFRSEYTAVTFRDGIDKMESRVVACQGVLLARVTQADDEPDR